MLGKHQEVVSYLNARLIFDGLRLELLSRGVRLVAENQAASVVNAPQQVAATIGFDTVSLISIGLLRARTLIPKTLPRRLVRLLKVSADRSWSNYIERLIIATKLDRNNLVPLDRKMSGHCSTSSWFVIRSDLPPGTNGRPNRF